MAGGEGLGSRGGPVRQTPALASLTPREREILTLIAKGHSNREIARLLYVSESTVKNHISSVYKKVGVSGRSRLVLLAIQNGLVSPDKLM
ncbi:MAG TPA: response regulator transcription factor [Firmicutes bacterium]|nr:response regulator transcription factor [Bacillota bacterium]